MALKRMDLPRTGRVLVEIPSRHARALIDVGDNGLRVVDDRCPHRGGPVHLAYRDADGALRCPWHDRRIGRLRPSAEVSAVLRRGDGALTIVADAPPGAPWPVRALGE